MIVFINIVSMSVFLRLFHVSEYFLTECFTVRWATEINVIGNWTLAAQLELLFTQSKFSVVPRLRKG